MNGFTEAAKIDVKGAFIQTPMEGPPVNMRCGRELTRMIVKRYLEFKKYVSKKGFLYCHLLKALYGCIQASKLWYNKLMKFLTAQGYEQSPIDPCVLRRIDGEKIYLLLVYVDDILVLADKPEIQKFKIAFEKEFRWITLDIGEKHSYLGMQLRFGDGFIMLDMIHYIQKLLESAKEELKVFSAPANKNIFVVKDGATLLSETERKFFHTLVAKLLFLSKRTRPEISTANGFLCTRVTKATEEDKQKLFQLLGFLQGTQKRVLTL